ncbi:GvpL/GvpF family gas vesicle protein [Streptomyces durbertensis]|uniref:GvpL/GvpF family gas vesicle protein n=1 Tax=Streptomyces durbertensis TaxID=2448886 RepID=A0ABR6EJW7_9ACTN|nr:GvpL/GvpF family gas vesicle protein [Streptomyces durbertensis]MBB1245629.1 GvpL/GvpF family gas vesicle protein [Streptomyces durbertensis]
MTTPSPAPAEPPEHAAGELTYVYAVGRDGPALRTLAPRLRGVDGAPVRAVGVAGLCALVSSAPTETFGERALADQLDDLPRLESLARAHHAVVDSAFGEAPPILPMRLATVYHDDARVRAMLGRRAEDFRNLLERLDNHVELGVKVHAVPLATAPAEVGAVPSGPGPAAGAGRAYLRQRQAQQRGGREAHRAAADIAARAAELAAGMSLSRVVHRPQQGQLATTAGVNVANEAYLVPVEHLDRFCRELTALTEATPQVTVEVTGPWAPYSFATTEGGGEQ